MTSQEHAAATARHISPRCKRLRLGRFSALLRLPTVSPAPTFTEAARAFDPLKLMYVNCSPAASARICADSRTKVRRIAAAPVLPQLMADRQRKSAGLAPRLNFGPGCARWNCGLTLPVVRHAIPAPIMSRAAAKERIGYARSISSCFATRTATLLATPCLQRP